MYRVVGLLKPIVLCLIVVTTLVSCNEIMQFVFGNFEENFYNGTGHGSKVILDNGSEHRYRVTLDNFTKDAFDIRERFDVPKTSFYYWLSFNYLTVSTSCREVNNNMVVFPNSISSPKWWPNDLIGLFSSTNKSRYKFYRCLASDIGSEYSYFEYLAIDNATKKGFYWKTISEFIGGSEMRNYYYDWENYEVNQKTNDHYDKWEETDYNGPGRSNKVILEANTVILDNGSEYTSTVTLDNYTKDAFDIRQRSEADARYGYAYCWVSFHYITSPTNCKEVDNSIVVFPASTSPNWWPDDLKKSFFPTKRSRYKFYRCRAALVRAASVFEFFAIDNTTKTGYYWRTQLSCTDEKTIRKYYYAWEDYK
ncbi:hypothetical protein [Candidatus Magnetominusculus dajiuhuensis]|uniref:hypothetical protein n=1 Tax=Candidatus Magnetominusculus dajiuhuensis TaxID=3137712 RepID=UPI003B43B2CD